MSRPITKWFEGLVFLSLTWVIVYRAITLSLSHDEAWMVQTVLSPDSSGLFGSYQANHHVLHSLLAAGSLHLFGPSELALRVPALLGGVSLILISRHICHQLLTRDLWRILVWMALVFQPLILDFCVAARGYSLALAMFAAGLSGLISFLQLAAARTLNETPDDSPGESGSIANDQPTNEVPIRQVPWYPPVFFALSVACVPSFLLPVAGAILAFLLVRCLTRPPEFRSFRRSSHDLARFLVAGCVVVGPLYGPLARHISFSNFHYGAPTPTLMFEHFFELYVRHNEGVFPAVSTFLSEVIHFAENPFWITLSLALLSGVARGFRFHLRSLLTSDLAVRLFLNLSLVFCFAVTLLVHFASGLPLPLNRTALPHFYLLFFALVALAGLQPVWFRLSLQGFGRFLAVLGLCSALSQWNMTFFAEWKFDAESREVFEDLEKFSTTRPERPLRVGAYFLSEPSLNVYREWRRANWISPIKKEIKPSAGADVYVLLPGRDEAKVSEFLEIIKEYPISGLRLAQPR